MTLRPSALRFPTLGLPTLGVGLLAMSLVLSGCGGGGGGGATAPASPSSPSAQRLFTDPAAVALTQGEVEDVLARAVAEAQARSAPATIAVVDRVGNVLAVYAMTGAPTTQAVPRARNGSARDVQGLALPSTLTAIAKALTGAYLSSSGNAFSSRTASMIVQEHFPPSPATAGLESGPLSGVQFSQLPCSDLNQRYTAGDAPGVGPKRSPLGFAADPGGFPLYKNGVVVGGVGVAADGDYGFDANVLDFDSNLDEAIAFAGASAFEAPEAIRADRISVDGTLLRFSDIATTNLLRAPASAPPFATLGSGVGAFARVRGYFDATTLTALAGVPYGVVGSGVAPAGSQFANADAYALFAANGSPRFPIIAGGDSANVTQPLTAAEVRAVLEEAFGVLSAARAQIRQPLGSRAQVSVAVVDTQGRVLGLVRSPDAPIFGIDVSLQKARSVAFFSNPSAAADLGGALRNPAIAGVGVPDLAVRDSVSSVRTFLNDLNALTGATAFSNRAIGNIARPYFPDGEVSRPPGPLSPPITEWSPFATGLQSALIVENLLQHVGFVLGANPDGAPGCAFLPPVPSRSMTRLSNGLQIFPGGVPIYRGSVLVGAIGVSGDGIDQDDMISFLGVARASTRLAGTIANAPSGVRADVLSIGGTRLRYVNCPFSPFLDSGAQNVCQGI